MRKGKALSALLACAMVMSLATAPASAAQKCPASVDYALGLEGVSEDVTAEKVKLGNKPDEIPGVTGLNGAKFLGWSLTDPATLKEGEKPKLVDPATVEIKEDTTFYAVYETTTAPEGDHKHYVKGYPNGNFGPGDNITRAEVAAIVARACLEDYHEGSDYGSGGYSDVEGHWARSAIAYCTRADVFKGYDDGTFKPDQPITRQEFALVFARMVGLETAGEVPFTDMGEAGSWALDGIYTAYSKGWVDGYTDGTFKPWNNIQRAEAVKIVNRYLNRGVDAQGIQTAFDQIKQWPDVPESYWAYYEIIEAANDHTYSFRNTENPPEDYITAYVETAPWGA